MILFVLFSSVNRSLVVDFYSHLKKWRVMSGTWMSDSEITVGLVVEPGEAVVTRRLPRDFLQRAIRASKDPHDALMELFDGDGGDDGYVGRGISDWTDSVGRWGCKSFPTHAIYYSEFWNPTFDFQLPNCKQRSNVLIFTHTLSISINYLKKDKTSSDCYR